MKRITLLLASILFNTVLFAQTDTAYQGKAGVADVADSDPGLFIVMMFLLIGVVVSFLLGVLFFAVIVGIIACLSLAGIISVSALMSLYTKSLKKGIRLFFQLSCSAAGIFLGIITASIIKLFWPVDYSFWQLSLWSVLGGCLGGFLLGRLLFIFLHMLYVRYAGKTSIQGH